MPTDPRVVAAQEQKEKELQVLRTKYAPLLTAFVNLQNQYQEGLRYQQDELTMLRLIKSFADEVKKIS
jgi:hypothetical protein